MTADEPGLPVATVARRLGVAPATLRTWDRRYGVGPSQHTAGAHRRYQEADLARLQVMHRLLLQGVPPREAAVHALREPDAGPASPQGGQERAGAPEPDAGSPSPAGRPDRPSLGPRGAGLPVQDAVRGINRAAVALDAGTVHRMVREQVRDLGVVRAWEQVLCPVLEIAGERWQTTDKGVEVEHLLSAAVSAVLQLVPLQLPTRPPVRPILLASTPGERHALPMHALAAALAEQGLACRLLGADLPAAALADAVRRTGPGVLFLWAQLPDTADVSVLTDLPAPRPRPALVAAGPGWDTSALPPRVSHADSLGRALSLVREALGH